MNRFGGLRRLLRRNDARAIALGVAVALAAGGLTVLGTERAGFAYASDEQHANADAAAEARKISTLGDPPPLTPCTLRRSGMRTEDIGNRKVSVYVPPSAVGRGRVPTMILLHGTGGTGAQQIKASRMAYTANKYGFNIAAPDGAVKYKRGYAWNVPGVPLFGGKLPPKSARSDIRYIAKVIDTMTTRNCADRQRTYLSGFSGGARMASAFACTSGADRIAAIAPVSGLRAGLPTEEGGPERGSCRPSRPVGVFAIQGTGDHMNPRYGGGQPYWNYGVLAAFGEWTRLDGCTTQMPAMPLTDRTNMVTTAGCAGNVKVRLVNIRGGHHQWPLRNAKVDPGLSVNDLMWHSLNDSRD